MDDNKLLDSILELSVIEEESEFGSEIDINSILEETVEDKEKDNDSINDPINDQSYIINEDCVGGIEPEHIERSIIKIREGKKRVHIILPGGGVKGGFQAGFLYHLFKNYGHLIEIVGIDGCSVGAVNGLALLSGRIEILRENWFSIENINDLFAPWSSKPLIGNILNVYYAFYSMGLYNNEKLLKRLRKYTAHLIPSISKKELIKYNCVVVNVNKGTTEYIAGTHPNIYEYITASASPWIISNPMLINGSCYTDGSILETYPLHNVENLDVDYHIVVGCDQSHIEEFEKKNNDFRNIGEYISVLIDLMRHNSKNSDKIREYLVNPPNNKKIIPIMNTMKISLESFNPASIREGFTQGELSGEDFARLFILQK